MKVFGRNARILAFALALISCDNNVVISQKLTHLDPKIYLKALDKNEKLPERVRELLNREAASSKSLAKFPVPYYLIPNLEAKYFRTKNFNTKISDQLVFIVSGEKYYKLFVHPDSDKIYSFLKNGYRYIGPSETEFAGSPVSGDKTLVVWTARNLSKTPFIVKTALSDDTIQKLNARFPAGEEMMDAPEMVNLIFKRSIKGTTERIEGQQITEVPRL